MATLQTLVDNFDDNSFDTGLWSRTSSSVIKEQNSQMEFIVPGDYTHYYLTSVNTYDLTASYAFFQFPQVPVVDNTFNIHVQLDDSNRFNWEINGDVIIVYKRVAGTWTLIWTDNYSASTHKWFRIREASGTIYWDTSNGSTWTNRATLATPFSITAVSIKIDLYNTSGATDTAIIDNFNYSIGLSPSASASASLSPSASVSPSSSSSLSLSPSASVSPSSSVSASRSPSASISPSASLSASLSPSASLSFSISPSSSASPSGLPSTSPSSSESPSASSSLSQSPSSSLSPSASISLSISPSASASSSISLSVSPSSSASSSVSSSISSSPSAAFEPPQHEVTAREAEDNISIIKQPPTEIIVID